jgi:ABC-type Fe3+/spermidine/putrescine transport system ATPase subunit
VRAAYGGGPPAVDGVNLCVARGTFFALLGPSGCGKTTLLRVVGGYHAPAAGRVAIGGRDVTCQPPERRDVGMVFQHYALFPHLSARGNVAFGLEMRGLPRRDRNARAEAMLDRVGLAAGERARRPRELSGGQQQRVALARALVIEPRLLLLDEPLANLDRGLRDQLRGELRDLQRRTGVTTLLVTHDQEEALALADRAGVMAAGRLLQEGTPGELYDRPHCPFVARAVGDANLLGVEAAGGDALQLTGGVVLPRCCLAAGGAAVPGGRVLLRPERCLLGPAAAGCAATWAGRVADLAFLGADLVVSVALPGGSAFRVRCRPTDAGDLRPGEPVDVGVPEGAAWALPESDSPGLSSPGVP